MKDLIKNKIIPMIYYRNWIIEYLKSAGNAGISPCNTSDLDAFISKFGDHGNLRLNRKSCENSLYAVLNMMVKDGILEYRKVLNRTERANATKHTRIFILKQKEHVMAVSLGQEDKPAYCSIRSVANTIYCQ